MRRIFISVAALVLLSAGGPTRADDWADAQAAFAEYDDRRALALLERAAQGCDPRAQRAWGLALRFGERLFSGLPADPVAAKRWLERATAGAEGASGCDSALPGSKRTRLGLYLRAAQVPEFVASHGAPVLFLDIRTRAEAAYVGMPVGADMLLPYMEHEDFSREWDSQRGTFRPQANAGFAQAVANALERRGLDRATPIVLLCRSGERSAKAADLLAALGHPRVYSVVDGFEGDAGTDGRRSVNGWKNAGLPWSYRLDHAKVSAGAL